MFLVVAVFLSLGMPSLGKLIICNTVFLPKTMSACFLVQQSHILTTLLECDLSDRLLMSEDVELRLCFIAVRGKVESLRLQRGSCLPWTCFGAFLRRVSVPVGPQVADIIPDI